MHPQETAADTFSSVYRHGDDDLNESSVLGIDVDGLEELQEDDKPR